MSRRAFPFLVVVCLVALGAAGAGIFFVAVPPAAPEPEPAKSAEPSPLAEVPETVFDFGTMDPFQEGRHTFVIYNRGDAPLKLEQGETTCKCTFSELPENVVPPKSVGRVTLEWKTHKVRDRFSNSAEVLTDSPNLPVIRFRIEGRVRHHVQTEPEVVLFPPMDPGEGAERSFLVYSQTWDEFHLDDVSVTVPGAEWSTRAATEEELKPFRATSGLHVDLKLPKDMKKGDFTGSVVFDAVPSAIDTVGQHYEVRFAGKVSSPFGIYGLTFLPNDALNLGTFLQGERKEWNGVIRLRGERQTLEVTSIETRPADLQVSVTPLMADGEPKPGMYRLKIVLPETAARGIHVPNTKPGEIVLHTDHPLHPEVRIETWISVLPAYAE